MSVPEILTNQIPGHWRFQVILNGEELQGMRVMEAKRGERGYVVEFLYGLDGQVLMEDDGSKPRTRVRFGKVEFREIPRSELSSTVRERP